VDVAAHRRCADGVLPKLLPQPGPDPVRRVPLLAGGPADRSAGSRRSGPSAGPAAAVRGTSACVPAGSRWRSPAAPSAGARRTSSTGSGSSLWLRTRVWSARI